MIPSETMPLLGTQEDRASVPSAPWTRSLPAAGQLTTGIRIPQAIAHRGYKALYPENTMLAFRSAVKAGAHALETDLHLSADGHVVLCHDRTLKRCYGVDRPVAECDWSYLKTLRTLKAPHEPLPRLVDLLEWLAEPDSGRDKIWLLLDIKPDDTPAVLMSAIADAVESVPRQDGVAWDQRILIGCWNTSFLDASLSLLPTFSAAHQSYTPISSSRYLRSPVYPGLSFNMLQPSLVGPLGSCFMKELRASPDADQRHLFVWTVNTPYWMRWAVKNGIDGVVTDDPAKYLDVVKDYERELATAGAGREAAGHPEEVFSAVPEPTTTAHRAKLYLQVVLLQTLIFLFTPLLKRTARWQFEPQQLREPKA